MYVVALTVHLVKLSLERLVASLKSLLLSS